VNRRLLVLSFHAPPELAVGGLRWTGLSRHLAERGWEVRMITASPGAETVAHPEGMHVSEVHRRTTLQSHYRRRRWKAIESDGGIDGNRAAGEPSARVMTEGRIVRAVRSNMGDLLWFPDHGRGWVLRAARATRRAVHQWAPDAVVSTGPPHSVHLAAGIALVGAGVPWMVDLRDPWATPAQGHRHACWSVALTRRLEAKVFQRASMILTTTPELRDTLKSHYPTARLEWLPNGVDTRELPQRPAERPAGVVITHLGTVYFNRDPTPVLRAFARFLAAQPDAATAGSAVRFVGNVSGDFRRRLKQTVMDLGIAEHVEIIGMVPRARALEILAESRMALVLAQGQSTMVPAKLYESVGMGLPTMVVTETDSATGREAKRLGAAVHGPDDEAGMTAVMTTAWLDGEAPDSEVPAGVDHAHLAGKLEEFLFSL
jgi:glycosyltransferase involved in cell wall biosynthesis